MKFTSETVTPDACGIAFEKRGTSTLAPSRPKETTTPPPFSRTNRLMIQCLFWAAALHRRVDIFLKILGKAIAAVFPFLVCSSITVPRIRPEDEEPGASIGPILSPDDAPGLFVLLRDISKRMGGMYPSEVRISYLPACGVLELTDSEFPAPRRVLIIGLPCLLIWSVQELSAVLAHEMAHLKRQDVAFLREVVEYSDELIARKNFASGWKRWINFRLQFGVLTGWLIRSLATPINWNMEYRADQCAADNYGGRALARALEKLAIVQPLFREVLIRFDALASPRDNVYSYFCRAWRALAKGQYEKLHSRLVTNRSQDDHRATHPPICERIARLRRNPHPPRKTASGAIMLFQSPKEIARVLHNRLYGMHETRTVFYRSRGD